MLSDYFVALEEIGAILVCAAGNLPYGVSPLLLAKHAQMDRSLHQICLWIVKIAPTSFYDYLAIPQGFDADLNFT